MKKIRGSGSIKDTVIAAIKRNQELQTAIQSKEIINIIDLVSEGQIEGLATGDMQSVFFDNTPVANADGSTNFTVTAFDSRDGTQTQDYIPGFPEVDNEISVSTEVTFESPVVREITSSQVDAVRVTISLPELISTDPSTGQITGNSVDIAIDIQTNGGGYVTKVTDTIIGTSSGQYEKSYLINLTGSEPWDIKVRRLSPDSNTVTSQSKTFFASYTEITDAKLSYPNSALFYMQLDSSQFSDVPDRAYLIKGLKIQIPANATVNADGSLTYSGVWDGTFQLAWCSNPAWILFDLLTSERYGLGSYISPSQVDKWALYSIGTYCDELVSDGDGGMEPRFSCNLYLQSQASAYQVVSDLTSCFQGMAYWSSGTINVVQDSPKDPTYLFTNANVLKGMFTYAGASATARHSVALVTWIDPANSYQQMVEYVEDANAIEQFGIIKTQVTAFGCTSRGQANRAGKWILFSEQNESETVTFSSGIEAAVLRPGQIVEIADQNRAGVRMGGRIISATSNSLTADQVPSGPLGGFILSVLLPDGTIQINNVSDSDGNTLLLSEDFVTVPTPNSIWMLSSTDVNPQLFRIVGVVESDGGQFDVSGLKYDPDKYAAIEENLILEPRKFSLLSVTPDTPSNIKVVENLYTSPQGVKAKFILSWDKTIGTIGYIVKYIRDTDNLVAATVTSNQFEVDDFTPGNYQFQVFSMGLSQKMSQPATLSQELFGKTARPIDMVNFSITPSAANIGLLTWTQATDLDVIVAGFVRIRYTPLISGQDWSNAIDAIAPVSGSTTSAQVPLLSGTYMGKFVDSSGNESLNAASIITTAPAILALNIVEIETETGVFSGDKTNCIYDDDLGALILNYGENIDDVADIDSIELIDDLGPVQSSGTYNFASGVDLGSVFTCRLTVGIQASSFSTTGTWDDTPGDMDSWADVDGADTSDTNAAVFFRSTDDDPGASPTWSDWKQFLCSEYSARAFQFQLRLTTLSSDHNIAIEVLSVTVDMPDRTEDQDSLVSSATGALAITYSYPFFDIPSIGITTTSGMAAGDYFTISSKSESGFSIEFFNALGVAVVRTFDMIAKGYGIQIS